MSAGAGSVPKNGAPFEAGNQDCTSVNIYAEGGGLECVLCADTMS